MTLTKQTTNAISIAGVVLITAILLSCTSAISAPKFAEPTSRCSQPSPSRVLTKVGFFPNPTGNYEIVADTKLKPYPDVALIKYGDPSITAYDLKCRAIWHQSFPQLSEIGFKTLNPPGGPILYVAGRSIFEPVDQTLSVDEPLVPSGMGLTEATPASGGDRYVETYVGPFGLHGALAVVNTIDEGSPVKGGKHYTLTIIYRWRPFGGGDGSGPWYAFTGPKFLDAKQTAALKLPPSPHWPDFPYSDFILGKGQF